MRLKPSHVPRQHSRRLGSIITFDNKTYLLYCRKTLVWTRTRQLPGQPSEVCAINRAMGVESQEEGKREPCMRVRVRVLRGVSWLQVPARP